MKKLIQIIRELESWPTNGKLLVLCRNDTELPSGKTISARLGNKGQRAARVLSYCEQKEGYDDIIKICEPIAQAVQRQEKKRRMV